MIQHTISLDMDIYIDKHEDPPRFLSELECQMEPITIGPDHLNERHVSLAQILAALALTGHDVGICCHRPDTNETWFLESWDNDGLQLSNMEWGKSVPTEIRRPK